MKSPMVLAADYITQEDKNQYSDLCVMHSGAGYYVGTIYHSTEGYDAPGTRDTGYFRTEAEAKVALAAIEQGCYTGLMRNRP